MKLYLAAPLFTQAETEFNNRLVQQLRRDGHQVYVPQEHGDTMGPMTMKATYEACIGGIKWADAVVAVLDGSDVDSGTAWECGYAVALGKSVYGLRTDFRCLQGFEAEMVNLMIQESCEDVYMAAGELVEALYGVK